MKKATLAVALVSLLFLMAGNASAVPGVDGMIDGAEWSSGLVINGFDPNEGAIPDAYDISRIAMISESGDGLYVLIDLYGTPSFTSLDELAPIDPVFYTTGIDVNGDGDFTDSADRIFDFRATGFTVYDGTGAVITDTGAFGVMDEVVEYYIPEDMLGGELGGFNTFTLLDNGGAPADDRMPDVGTNTTIPEPTSMLLLGSGLLGALGYRRKNNIAL